MNKHICARRWSSTFINMASWEIIEFGYNCDYNFLYRFRGVSCYRKFKWKFKWSYPTLIEFIYCFLMLNSQIYLNFWPFYYTQCTERLYTYSTIAKYFEKWFQSILFGIASFCEVYIFLFLTETRVYFNSKNCCVWPIIIYLMTRVLSLPKKVISHSKFLIL